MYRRRVTGKSLGGHSKRYNNLVTVEDFITPIDENVRWFRKNMNCVNRKKATARIFSYIWMVMVNMLLDEKKRVRLPYTNWFLDMGKVEDFKAARQAGFFKGTDILKTGFQGNMIYIDAIKKRQIVYIQGSKGRKYNKLARTTLISTTSSAETTEIKKKVTEKYPFLINKDIEHVFRAFRIIQWLIRNDCKIYISYSGFEMNIGGDYMGKKDYSNKSRALSKVKKETDKFMFFTEKDLDILSLDNIGLRSVVKLRNKNVARDISFADFKNKCYIFKLLKDPKEEKVTVDSFIYIGYYDKSLDPAMISTKDLLRCRIKKLQTLSQEG